MTFSSSGHSEVGKRGVVEVLSDTVRWILPAYALLLVVLTFIDRLDPTAEPYVDLTGAVALTAWAFAESGQTFGIVTIAAALFVVLATRPGPSRRTRVLEAVVMIAVSLLVLYGGKLLNDGVVKPAVDVARPNIVQLAELDLLGMDVDSFYEMPEASRSEHLDSIKTDSGFGEIVMRPEVRDHWVKETAFSRPSGHSLASMTFATFYVSIALALLSGWRRWPFFVLVPWAVCVCLSRAVLRVHWPADILIGGLAGIVVGVGGFLLTRFLLDRLGAALQTES
jgi:membrane-associated phospholipid phosphatase